MRSALKSSFLSTRREESTATTLPIGAIRARTTRPLFIFPKSDVLGLFPIIEKIVAVIGPLHNPLRLEGHTDSIPIHNARFQSNWELSTARGIAMLETLRQRYHVPSERMSVAGFAENAPADTNETAEGRMHNRRVDVVVLSAEALRGEPPSAPPRT